MGANNKRVSFFIISALFFIVLLLAHSSYYLPFITDDSLISLRYADRMLEGKGLTWTDGDRVEGYSNLLWILLVAGLGAIGMDLIDAARVLGFLGMSGVMLAILWWYTTKSSLRDVWFPVSLGLLFYSLAAPTAVWAIGGMEQPLYGALIGVSVIQMYSIVETDALRKIPLVLLSVVLGLICITRPDGPIFTVAAVITFYLYRRSTKRNWPRSRYFLLLMFPFVFYGGQLVFRLFYYGEFVPNTALLKIVPSPHHFYVGLKYVVDGLWALFPFSLYAAISLFLMIRFPRTAGSRSAGFYLSVMIVMWMLYLIFIGGDIFSAHRHFVPIIVVFAFALIEGIRFTVDRIKNWPSPVYYWVFVGLVTLSFVPYTYIQFTDDQNIRAVHERWEWRGKTIGLFLKAAFAEQQPLLAVTAAGCLPYWSELPALDMLGLNDRYIAWHPPEGIGWGVPGHEHGSSEYVLSREPDIICYHLGTVSANFGFVKELQGKAEYKELYTPVVVEGYRPQRYAAALWIRKYSEKIGIKQTKNEVVIPGYLLNQNPGTVSYLNESNKLVVSVEAGKPVGVIIERLPPGSWEIDIKASGADRITPRIERSEMTVYFQFVTENPEPIEIEDITMRNVGSNKE